MDKVIQTGLFMLFLGILSYGFFSIYKILVEPLEYLGAPGSIAQPIGEFENTSLKMSCIKAKVKSVYDLRCRVIPTLVTRF